MNKLSYGLLSLLAVKPMTGYDLTIKINKFWRSTHSAIYPLLSELEENGYIELTLIEQTGKLDKKLYDLTTKGNELLHEWLISESNEEVVRDEMTLKLYCLKCISTEAAEKVLDEYEERCRSKMKSYQERIESLKQINHMNQMNQDKIEETPESAFGSYILTQRVLKKTEQDLEWCIWVRNIYNKPGFSFLDVDYM